MTNDRFNELMNRDELTLTAEELAEGWHFCAEFDGLLVRKKDASREGCGQHCVDSECGDEPEGEAGW